MSTTDCVRGALLALLVAGCGAADPGTSDSASSGDPQIDGEVARVKQSLGEATCGSVKPYATLSPGGAPQGIGSDYTYDDPLCRNAFVIEDDGVKAGESYRAGSVSGWDLFCGFHWSRATLWQKQASAFVQVQDVTTLGGTLAIVPTGQWFCQTYARVTAPAAGDYKIITAAGVLFGSYTRTSVIRD